MRWFITLLFIATLIPSVLLEHPHRTLFLILGSIAIAATWLFLPKR
jgi:hypothetical protein